MNLRDRWVDLCHRLPPFRGRLAIARWVGRALLSHEGNRITFVTLPNGYRVKVDLGWSQVYESLYYFRTPYEGSLMGLIRGALERDGASFIDVGANIGVFSLSVADILVRRGGRALAVEPMPENYALLRESVEANDLGEVVKTARCGAGDREGSLVLSRLPYGDISNAIPLTWGAGGSSDEEILRWSEPAQRLAGVAISQCPMKTLDSLVAEHGIERVAMVKIDVEGAELFVLLGARNVLESWRPVVYAEFHEALMAANGTTYEALVEFSSHHRYDLRFLNEGGTLEERRPPPGARYLHAVLVPKDS